MTPRLLALLPEGHEAAIGGGLSGIVAVARATGAATRIAYVHALPRPRLDEYDRVVVDRDGEMARIDRVTTAALESAARTFTDLRIEVVVRFGRLRREAAVELEVYAPDTVVVLSSPAAPVRTRVAAWRLRRSLARESKARLLVIEPGTPAAPRRPLSELIAQGLGTLDLRLP